MNDTEIVSFEPQIDITQIQLSYVFENEIPEQTLIDKFKGIDVAYPIKELIMSFGVDNFLKIPASEIPEGCYCLTCKQVRPSMIIKTHKNDCITQMTNEEVFYLADYIQKIPPYIKITDEDIVNETGRRYVATISYNDINNIIKKKTINKPVGRPKKPKSERKIEALNIFDNHIRINYDDGYILINVKNIMIKLNSIEKHIVDFFIDQIVTLMNIDKQHLMNNLDANFILLTYDNKNIFTYDELTDLFYHKYNKFVDDTGYLKLVSRKLSPVESDISNTHFINIVFFREPTQHIFHTKIFRNGKIQFSISHCNNKNVKYRALCQEDIINAKIIEIDNDDNVSIKKTIDESIKKIIRFIIQDTTERQRILNYEKTLHPPTIDGKLGKCRSNKRPLPYDLKDGRCSEMSEIIKVNNGNPCCTLINKNQINEIFKNDNNTTFLKGIIRNGGYAFINGKRYNIYNIPNRTEIEVYDPDGLDIENVHILTKNREEFDVEIEYSMDLNKLSREQLLIMFNLVYGFLPEDPTEFKQQISEKSDSELTEPFKIYHINSYLKNYDKKCYLPKNNCFLVGYYKGYIYDMYGNVKKYYDDNYDDNNNDIIPGFLIEHKFYDYVNLFKNFSVKTSHSYSILYSSDNNLHYNRPFYEIPLKAISTTEFGIFDNDVLYTSEQEFTKGTWVVFDFFNVNLTERPLVPVVLPPKDRTNIKYYFPNRRIPKIPDYIKPDFLLRYFTTAS